MKPIKCLLGLHKWEKYMGYTNVGGGRSQKLSVNFLYLFMVFITWLNEGVFGICTTKGRAYLAENFIKEDLF